MQARRFVNARTLKGAVAGLVLSGLVACGTGGGAKSTVGQYDQLMSSAEAQVSANAFDEAIKSFDLAAKADPTQKDPWVRNAQLHFDTGSYGRAIVAAQEALARDPSDRVADSVLTLGGLRLASQSLRRLQDNGGIAGEAAKAEARQLAGAMRSIIGEPQVAPAKPTTTRTPARRRPAAAPAPAVPAKKPASADPFNKLGGN